MSQSFSLIRLMILTLMLMVILAGCANAPNPSSAIEEGVIEGEIIASSLLNPAPSGESASVNILIFELSSIEAFQSSGFFSLHHNAQDVLGEELIHMEKLSIAPNEKLLVSKYELNKNTRYIAVIANFRDWKKSKWRDIMSIAGNDIKYRVGVEGSTIQFLLSIPELMPEMIET